MFIIMKYILSIRLGGKNLRDKKLNVNGNEGAINWN